MRSHSRLKIIMPDEPALKPVQPSRKPSPYEMRPLVQVRRIALFEREIREYLSQAALDVVFARMDVLSEGECSSGQAGKVFVGSTMLTCDVAALADVFREPADEGTARHLGELLGKEKTLEARTQRIVRREVERITSQRPKAVRGQTGIRTQGTRVFLDIDVEATL
jgi:hypothetical protein